MMGFIGALGHLEDLDFTVWYSCSKNVGMVEFIVFLACFAVYRSATHPD